MVTLRNEDQATPFDYLQGYNDALAGPRDTALTPDDYLDLGLRAIEESDIPPDPINAPALEDTKSFLPQDDEIQDPRMFDKVMNAGRSALRTVNKMMISTPLKGVAFLADNLQNLSYRVAGIADDKDLKDYAMFRWGQAYDQMVDKALPPDPRLKDSFVWETLPSGFSSMAMFMLSGPIGAAAGLSRATSVAMAGATLEATHAYEKARAKGATEDQALQAANLSIPLGAIEAIPIERILSKADKASGGVIKKAIADGGVEALQEFMQTAGGEAIALGIYEKDKTFWDKLEEVEGDIAEATAAGGIVGGVTSVIVSLITGSKRFRYDPETENVVDTKPPKLPLDDPTEMSPEEAAQTFEEFGLAPAEEPAPGAAEVSAQPEAGAIPTGTAPEAQAPPPPAGGTLQPAPTGVPVASPEALETNDEALAAFVEANPDVAEKLAAAVPQRKGRGVTKKTFDEAVGDTLEGKTDARQRLAIAKRARAALISSGKVEPTKPPEPKADAKPPKKRTGLKAARTEVESIGREMGIVADADAADVSVDVETGMRSEELPREGFALPNTKSGRATRDAILDRVPTELRGKAKARIRMDSNLTQSVEDQLGGLDEDRAAQLLVEGLQANPEARAQAVLKQAQESPELFSPEQMRSIREYEQIAYSPETAKTAKAPHEQVNASEFAPGDTFSVAGQPYTVERTDDPAELYLSGPTGEAVRIDRDYVIIDEDTFVRAPRDPAPVQEAVQDATDFPFGALAPDTRPDPSSPDYTNLFGEVMDDVNLFGDQIVAPKPKQEGEKRESELPGVSAQDRKIEKKWRPVAKYTPEIEELTGQPAKTEHEAPKSPPAPAEQLLLPGDPAIEEGVDPPKGAVGVIPPGMRIPPQSPSGENSHWPSDEVAERVAAARGLKPESALDKLKAMGESAWANLTRAQRFLPNSEAYASANMFFRHLKDVPQWASDTVMRQIGSVVKALSPSDYRLFNDYIIVINMVDARKHDEPFRFGFESDEQLTYAKATLERKIADRAPVRNAIERRRQMVKEMVTRLVQYDVLPAQALERADFYFHQHVLMFAEMHRQSGGTRPRKTKRSFQKQRVKVNDDGSESMPDEYDWNTEYIESEYRWMVEASMEMRKEHLRRKFISRYDIFPLLKREAKRRNYETAVGGKEKAEQISQLRSTIASMREAGSLSGDEQAYLSQLTDALAQLDPTHVFRQRMAQGFSMIESDVVKGNYAGNVDVDDLAAGDFRALAALAGEDADNNANIGARMIFKAMGERQKLIKELAGKAYVTPHDLIDEHSFVDRGTEHHYDSWQAEPGNLMYPAFTIPERIAEQIEKGITPFIDPEQVKRARVMGGKRGEMILPQPLVAQLSTIQKGDPPGPITRAVQWSMRAIKVRFLLAPDKFVGYSMRNMFGDIDPVIAVGGYDILNPKRLAEVESMLRDYYVKQGVSVPPLLKEARDVGVLDASMVEQEIPSLHDLKFFRDLSNRKFDPSAMPANAVKKYFDVVRRLNAWREHLMRVAAFDAYKKSLKSGSLKHFGGGKRKVALALKREHGVNEAAGYLARNLLGDYGDMTVFGSMMRQYVYPFYSWVEVNYKRYPRMAVNAVQAGQDLKGVSGMALKSFVRAVALPGIAAWYAAQWAWNHLLFPSKEDELGVHDKANAHVLLCRNEDGSVRILRNTSAFGDFMDWFGLNTLINERLIEKLENDQMSGWEFAKEMLKDPANKFVQGLNPILKGGSETLLGVSMFPDAFNWRTQDRDAAIASAFGLRDEYRQIKGWFADNGLRARPNYIARMMIGVADPSQNALFEMYELRNDYLKSVGKDRGRVVTPASPFGPMKYAAMYDDFESFAKAREKYLKDGKDAKSFRASLARVDPVEAYFNDEDERGFVDFLSARQKRRLDVARGHAQEIRLKLWDWWQHAESDPDAVRTFRADTFRGLARALTDPWAGRRQRGESVEEYRQRRQARLDSIANAREKLIEMGAKIPELRSLIEGRPDSEAIRKRKAMVPGRLEP